MALATNCRTIKEIPVKDIEKTQVKDSIIYNTIDSIRIIPIERIVNVTLPNQISELETSLAKSQAYTDSLGFLHHHIENKKTFIQHIHKEETLHSKSDTTYIKKTVPYKVIEKEKYIPKFYKFTLYYFIITCIIFVIFIFIKIKTFGYKNLITYFCRK